MSDKNNALSVSLKNDDEENTPAEAQTCLQPPAEIELALPRRGLSPASGCLQEQDLSVSDESDTEPINEEVIYPGLILKEDYLLLKKIGFGNNANVWMVYQISSKTYYAMKLQDYQCFEDGCREVAIIKKITAYAKLHKFKNTYCITMIDYFVYEVKDQFKYVCSIYELYAGGIHLVLDSGKHKYGFPIQVVKNIIRQLLTALTILHNELHIIHTDVKTENILFKGVPPYQQKIIDLFIRSGFQQKYNRLIIMCKISKKKIENELKNLALESINEISKLEDYTDSHEALLPDDEEPEDDDLIEGDDDLSEEDLNEDEILSEEDKPNKLNKRRQSIDDLIEYLDYSETHDLEIEGRYDFVNELNNRANGRTTDTKEIINDDYIMNCQIALTDFGNAYFYNHRTSDEIQDRRYRAPEVILDLGYGYPCDIWSVGCVTFELLTGFVLFEPEDEPLNRDIHHLFLMETFLGPLPIHMKKKSKRSRFLFNRKNNYHLKNVEPFNQYPLKERLANQFLFSEEDAQEISEFIMNALRYDPNNRLTAKKLLEHRWLKL